MRVPSAIELRDRNKPQPQRGWQIPPSFSNPTKEDATVRAQVGEVVVPREVVAAYPQIAQLLRLAMHEAGGDDRSFAARFVGSPEGVYNDNGTQEFGFFSSIGKALKSVFSNPIARTAATIGAGLIPGVGEYAAPIVAAGTTKLGGGGWGEAIGAGVGTLASEFIGNKIGSNFGQLGTLGELTGLDGSVGGINLNNALGAFLGQTVGGAIGGAILPKKTSVPNPNIPELGQGANNIPAYTNAGNPWWATTPVPAQSPQNFASWDVPTIGQSGVSLFARPFSSQNQADYTRVFGNNIYGSNRRAGFGSMVYA